MRSGPLPFTETGSPLAVDPLLGTVVNGKYHILSVAGAGGMGKIYQAEQIPLGRPAALKVLNPTYTSSSKDQDFQRRFFLEASILSRLQHPNIVTVFDYGCVEGTQPEMYFMAMEFLAGETLERRTRRNGRMSVEELLPIVRQIARGLHDAHQQGVVHRDLKPSNVMLVPRPDGSALVKIVDFGLVKVLGTDSDQITREGTFLGSARYMSPEQIVHGGVDHRTDVYALGVLMFEALCGVPPFQRDEMVQTLMAHINDPVPEMAVVAPDARVPAAVEAFVRRCMAKSPSERPSDMDAVLAEISVCARVLGMAPVPSDRYDVDSGAITRSGRFERPLDVPTRAEVRPALEAPTQSEVSIPQVASALAPSAVGPTPPSASWKLWLAGAAALLVVGLVLALVITMAARDESDKPPATTASSAGVPPADFSRTFVLWLDSTPSGAEVVEGDTVLGTTPMQLSIENEVVRASPKRLTLRSPGHRPYSLVQGPSDGNVRVAAALQPLPEGTESVPPKTGRGPAPRETKAPAPPTQPADPGIRLRR
jgi:serine/threonine protein kinase